MNKIPPLVLINKLFPEFYREEYPALVEFIEAYYEFLNTETFSGKILGIRDLDSTIDLFADQLRKELALAMPDETTLDKRELLRNAKAFYSSKGTEASYKFLFRALFGTSVEIFYPSSVILRASDGRWEQDTELQVRFTTGNPADIVGRRVRIECEGQPVSVFVNRIRLISGNEYEVFIDRNFVGDIAPGDTIGCPEIGVQGDILPVLSSVTITVPGSGFTTGQIFDVDGPGTGAKIRVTRTLSGGSLKKVELVRFGSGYTADFDQTIGNATIRFHIGAVARYPGYFSSSNGFLSDAMRLQDNEFYQAYSYVLKLDQTIDRYRAIIKSLVHPVGWALFGDFEITNEISLGTAILETARFLRQSVQDDVLASDDEIDFRTIKVLESSVDPIEVLTFDVTKYLESDQPVLSSGSITREVAGDYATNYFAEVGTSQYSMGEGSEIRTW